MQDFVVLHLCNAAEGADAELNRVLEARHVRAVRRLRGFKSLQRFRCSPHQLMPDIRQAWTYASLYEFALSEPEIDLPALAPLLADMRDAGLTAADDAERIYSYAMYHPWKYSANYREGPLSHLMFLLANVVPGHEAEYHEWYDRVHSVEVSESPGYVGMRRGTLSAVQVPPVRYCPGDQLILGGIQTSQLAENLREFYDRAMGVSPSGVAWGPRSTAASVARTVHIFESVNGPFE
jgi:heme-degrading monooxygenase HmoA